MKAVFFSGMQCWRQVSGLVDSPAGRMFSKVFFHLPAFFRGVVGTMKAGRARCALSWERGEGGRKTKEDR